MVIFLKIFKKKNSCLRSNFYFCFQWSNFYSCGHCVKISRKKSKKCISKINIILCGQFFKEVFNKQGQKSPQLQSKREKSLTFGEKRQRQREKEKKKRERQVKRERERGNERERRRKRDRKNERERKSIQWIGRRIVFLIQLLFKTYIL